MVNKIDSLGYTPSGLVIEQKPTFNLEYPSLADLYIFGYSANSSQSAFEDSIMLNRMIVDYFNDELEADVLGDAIAEIADIDPIEWAYIETKNKLY